MIGIIQDPLQLILYYMTFYFVNVNNYSKIIIEAVLMFVETKNNWCMLIKILFFEVISILPHYFYQAAKNIHLPHNMISIFGSMQHGSMQKHPHYTHS